MVVGFRRGAFRAGNTFIFPVEQFIPAAVLVVDQVVGSIRKQLIVPLGVDTFSGFCGKKRRGCDRFRYHPVVFIRINDFALWRECKKDAAECFISAFLPGFSVKFFSCLNYPRFREMAVKPHQQFASFQLMAGNKAVWAELIFCLVKMIGPIRLPVRCVVFPDHSAGSLF